MCKLFVQTGLQKEKRPKNNQESSPQSPSAKKQRSDCNYLVYKQIGNIESLKLHQLEHNKTERFSEIKLHFGK